MDEPVRRTGLIVAAALLALLLVFLWLVRGILAPFVISMAIAAILNPPLEKLRQRGLPRIWSVVIVYVLFFALFGGFITWLVPVIASEARSLAHNWVEYINGFKTFWTALAHSELVRRFHLPVPATWAELSDRVGEFFKKQGPEVFTHLLGGVSGTVGYVLNVVIILIATFSMMNDWPSMRRRVHYIIPPQHREDILAVMDRVGAVFLSYLRGLVTVCFVYGVTATILLSAFRLNYVFILGLIAGLLYAVPYVGATLLAVTCGLVAYVGTGSITYPLWVVGSLLVMNFCFDYIITPRILGRSTGLHPLVNLFAILAGSELFGFVGFIIGVPVAASIAIIASALYPRLTEEIPADMEPDAAARTFRRPRGGSRRRRAKEGKPST